MRKVGFIICPGYQPMGFAVTSPFASTNERTDHDVIPVRVTQCELRGACVWIHMRLLF